MKKFILSICIASLGLYANADLTADGFYRVKNYGSERWCNMIDNKASVDFLAGVADLHSLELTNNTEAILSSPGSVVLLTKMSGNQYDISAQGTTLSHLVNNSISIMQNGSAENGQALYRIYGTQKGVTKYIGDARTVLSYELGKASINVSSTKFLQWEILPISASSDNFFGVVPTVEANDKQYTTLYTSFAYKPYSEGMKAYYIGRVGNGMAEILEVADFVPQTSPVIIECVGATASDNRVELSQSTGALNGNSLKGVYFDYNTSENVNQVKYNPATMRVLGACSDGSLGFVTADIQSIPANSAYLIVPQDSPAEFKCVTSEEFDAAGVDSIMDNGNALSFDGQNIVAQYPTDVKVYNMAGQLVMSAHGDYINVSNLAKGVYLVAGAGTTIKISL